MKYGDLEANVLACLLIRPEYFEETKLEEKHFKRFNDLFIFFKTFYSRYKNLDIAIMFNVVKDTSQFKLMENVEYLLNIFVIPEHFKEYEKQLLTEYNVLKKEKWLRKKIYEKANEMYVGNISIDSFIKEIDLLKQKADSINWNK